jgi:DDE_Tnp_1-associated
MSYNLFDYLKQVKEFRRREGQRHALWSVMAMIIMAIISGHQSLKGFARFMKANEQELASTFQLKHGVPSFGTIRTILLEVDIDQMRKMFISWMKPHLTKHRREKDDVWLSLDGKCLSSTVKDAQGSLQDFVMVVSLFAHENGLVMAMQPFGSKKAYEPQVVRDLIYKLGLRDVIYTLDALHCQKKH